MTGERQNPCGAESAPAARPVHAGPEPRPEPRPGSGRDGRGGRKAAPFWRTKTLADLTAHEWESLCDGCARCCLVKLEDVDTGEFHFTDVACTLLDAGACRCRAYSERDVLMPDCVRLTPEVVPTLGWLPASCAYRLVAEGQDLPSWHPLVTGDPDSVHAAGMSVRDRVSNHETNLTMDEIVERVVDWPNETRR